MDKEILDKLKILYPNSFDRVHSAINHLIDELDISVPKVDYSEKDAVLICYADHIKEQDTKSLVSLKKFLDKYCKGLLSHVHILPFYPYSSDDGFSVIDYYSVKSEFGDWEEIRNLEENFSLMFDLVINHVSSRSKYFKAFIDEGKNEDMFHVFDNAVDTEKVFRPRTHPLLTRFDTCLGKKYVWTTFSKDQIDWNFSDSEVFLEMIKILFFYVQNGAKFIRLDAIAFLWKELGTRCLHRPQTYLVVNVIKDIINKAAPGVKIITETNVPHKENISYFKCGADIVYNFTLPPLLLYTFMKGDTQELSSWVENLEYPDKGTFFNFTASHDGIGVTPLIGIINNDEITELAEYVRCNGGKVNYRSVPGIGEVAYELNCVYLDSVGSIEKFLVSQAIQLSLKGVPGIYFNSLIGAKNWQEGVDILGHNRAINRQKFSFSKLCEELDAKETSRNKVYSKYSAMLKARSSEPLFSPKTGQEVIRLNKKLFAIIRHDGNNKLIAIANVSERDLGIDSNIVKEILGKEYARDIITGNAVYLEDSIFNIGPYQVFWIK